MQISVVVLDEGEMQAAVGVWLAAKFGGPVSVTSCKQVTVKRGRKFAVAVQTEPADARGDTEPEAG